MLVLSFDEDFVFLFQNLFLSHIFIPRILISKKGDQFEYVVMGTVNLEFCVYFGLFFVDEDCGIAFHQKGVVVLLEGMGAHVDVPIGILFTFIEFLGVD